MITGGGDSVARIWSPETGQEFHVCAQSNWVWAVAFSPDGKHLATSGADRSIRIWDWASGVERSRFVGHPSPATALSFSQDARRLVSGDSRGSVRLWTTELGKEVLLLAENGPAILDVDLSPGGQRIRAMGRDQSTMTWDAASPAQLVRWTEAQQKDEQRIAAQRLAARQESERKEALLRAYPGAIRQWLVLAPIPLDASVALPTREEASVLHTPQHPQEAELRPRMGEAFRIGARELNWAAVAFEDYSIDFNELLGETTDAALVYAVAHVQSNRAHTNVTLWVGSDDSSKVFLNSEEVHRMPFGGFFGPDNRRVDGLRLNTGLNTVVFKVVNTFGDWRGAVRFSDAAGQPIPGLRVTLNPEDTGRAP